MEDPKIAAKTPATPDLEAGRNYAWCACGGSADGTFCDGSHAGSPFRPVVFQRDEAGTAALCRCKRTSTPPYCDGTHAGLG